jgi:hypothetical protein
MELYGAKSPGERAVLEIINRQPPSHIAVAVFMLSPASLGDKLLQGIF